MILRLLENGSISVERVNELKDDVQFYVESHTVCFTANAILFWHDSRMENIRMMKTSRRMRASMMSSISTKRKRSLASLMMMMTAMVLRMQVKV